MSAPRRSALFARLLDAGAIPEGQIQAKVTYLDTDDDRDAYRVARQIILDQFPDAEVKHVGAPGTDSHFEILEVTFNNGEDGSLQLMSPYNPDRKQLSPSLVTDDEEQMLRTWARDVIETVPATGAERIARAVLALVGPGPSEDEPIASRRALVALNGGKGAA